jgi:hypothetical protein
MLSDLVKAFEIANTPVLVLSSPNAVVVEVTTALLRKWNCHRDEIIGRPIMKFGAGVLSARYSAGANGQIVEVAYTPPDHWQLWRTGICRWQKPVHALC